VVRFSGKDETQAKADYDKMYAYYQQHQNRFGTWQACYTNGKFPLADLEGEFNSDAIESRQLVKSVQFI
jgi:hypothetical protein